MMSQHIASLRFSQLGAYGSWNADFSIKWSHAQRELTHLDLLLLAAAPSCPAGTATWSITSSCWSPGPSTSAPSQSWCPSATRWAASSRWRPSTSPRPPPSSTTPSWWTRPWVRSCWQTSSIDGRVFDWAAGGAKAAFCSQPTVRDRCVVLLQLRSSRTAYLSRTWTRWTLRSFGTRSTRWRTLGWWQQGPVIMYCIKYWKIELTIVNKFDKGKKVI